MKKLIVCLMALFIMGCSSSDSSSSDSLNTEEISILSAMDGVTPPISLPNE